MRLDHLKHMTQDLTHIYDQLKHADQPVVNVLLEQFMLVQCIILFFFFCVPSSFSDAVDLALASYPRRRANQNRNLKNGEMTT